MRDILIKSGLITLVSITVSTAITAVVLPAAGLKFNHIAILLSVFCPAVTATPAAFLILFSRKRLADTHAELHLANESLATAHAELARAHGQLAHSSRFDHMTGLLNRESFFAALDEARAGLGTRSGVLLIIDADNFKNINDSYGHSAGDEALVSIAGAIEEAVGGGGICGRIGGEEFAVYVGPSDLDQARNAAEHIRRAVRRIDFRPNGGKPVSLSVSIGGAAHRPALSVSDLMRAADARLYEAKRAGRNRTVFAAATDKVAAA